MSDVAEEKIRVLVIGESAVARAGLEAAVSGSDRFEVVGSTNMAESSAVLDSVGADVVLLESHTFRAWTPEGDSTQSPPRSALTPREIEVLRMIADGASNKIIAWKLGISDHTVKFHVTSILSKLNAGSRTEAVTLGVRLGLIYL